MIQYKCIKCGAKELEALADGRQAMCPYCNSVTVLPTLDPEVFNRANDLRLSQDFDRAKMAFERIVEDNPKDSESYWNLVLCRYGIEYVPDYNGTMVPTCHRMSYDSILEDSDYQNALKYADGASYRLYQSEAAKIDAAMKRIAKIAQTQKPYDIFISYKETDSEKRRTHDSIIAQDIYEAIKEKHPELNVFLSRIEMDKISGGMGYEPVIFSALNSARLMIVVGTSRENLESPWVRNEWSRYRKMMEKEPSKKMITVFSNMNPAKDFPKELRLLDIQASEARGLYLPDLVSGIEKLLGLKNKPTQEQPSYVYVQANTNQTANLIRRAEQEIQRGQLDSARNFYNMALENDSGCIGALWGLFRLDTNFLKHIDDTRPFELSSSTKKIWRKIADSDDCDEKSTYVKEFNAYRDRWNKAAEDRALEDNRMRADIGFAKLVEQTKTAKNFDEYATYKRSGTFAKDLYKISDTEQKQRLDGFYSMYEGNFQKFKELQEFKKTNPEDRIKELPECQKLAKAKDATETQYYRSRKGENGVFFVNFFLTVIIALLAYLSQTVLFKYVEITIHVLPLLVSLSVFSTVVGIFHKYRSFEGAFEWEEKNIFISIVPAIATYFFVQYQTYLLANAIDSGINWHCIFWGVIVLLFVLSIGVGIFVAVAAESLWAGAICGGILLGISYAIYHFVPFFSDSESIPYRILIQVCSPVFNWLTIAAIAASIIRLIMYIVNKYALIRSKTAKKEYDAADNAYWDFYSSKCDELTEVYKEFVDEAYLEDLTELDVINE